MPSAEFPFLGGLIFVAQYLTLAITTAPLRSFSLRGKGVHHSRTVYVRPHTGTVPVLALGPKILPVVELGVFLSVVAPCVEFFCRCHNGVEFRPR